MRVVRDNFGRRVVLGAASVLAGLRALGDGDERDTVLLVHRGVDEPLEWPVDGLASSSRLVTCVLVGRASVTFVGSLHVRHVSGVVTRQLLHRHNTGRVFAPARTAYTARPLYVLAPLASGLSFTDLVLLRLSLLVTGKHSLVAAHEGARTDEERAVRAVQWHEVAFADISCADDDASEAALAAATPLLEPHTARQVAAAERWVRLVRTYMLAPTQDQLLALLLPPLKRVPARKPRRRGTGKPNPATFRVAATGEPAHSRTLFPVRRATRMPAPVLDPAALERVPGWSQLSAAHTGLPGPGTVEMLVPIRRVPELVGRRAVRPVRGVAAVTVWDAWALRVQRPVTVARPEALALRRHLVRVRGPRAARRRWRKLDLPPIGEVGPLLPPCMQALVEKMTGGHLKHQERLALFPYLHVLGYSPADVWRFAEGRWDPGKWPAGASNAQKDLNGFATEADKGESRVTGCAKMPTCPFRDIEDLDAQTACFQHVRGPGTTSKVFSPYFYVVLKTNT